jgi:hypothetical protein
MTHPLVCGGSFFVLCPAPPAGTLSMGALPGSDSRTGQSALWSNETRFIHSGELQWVRRRRRDGDGVTGGQQTGEECVERARSTAAANRLPAAALTSAMRTATSSTANRPRSTARQSSRYFCNPLRPWLEGISLPAKRPQYLSLRPIWGFSLASILNCYYNSNNTHWR